MTGFVALYLVLLAAVTGYGLIARAPDGLHLPLLAGTAFVNGIVLAGAIVVLGHADTTLERVIGFAGVFLGTANAVGSYVATERLLEVFKSGGGKG